ncbi:Methyl-accepting chemotaxis protein (fragment) [Candidatus Terasakiella magnetica]
MGIFDNMSISKRLAILLVAMIVPTLVVTWLGFQGMGLINASLKTVYEDRAVCLVQLGKILDGLHRQQFKAVEAAAATDPAAIEKALGTIRKSEQSIDKEWKDYLASYLDPDEKKMADKMAEFLKTHRTGLKTLEEALLGNDRSKAAQAAGTITENFEPMSRIVLDLTTLQESVAKSEYEKSTETYMTTRIINGVVFLGGLLLSVGLAFVIIRSITVGLTLVTAVMDKLAAGDLAVAVVGAERRDEVGGIARALDVFKQNGVERQKMETAEKAARATREARQQAIEKMTSAFDHSVSEVLEVVSGAATEMESTAQAMSANAEETNRQATTVATAAEQASSNVQTVASAAEELSSSISEIGRQVAQSSRVAQAASDEANRTNATVNALAENSARIGEVVKLINDIASQTNLLALNATIEAARAGDAGKGFAVVATEVKNLANQTAKATEDISQQIAGVQSATKEAVVAIGGIVLRIEEVNQIAAAIAAAVEEQSAATTEIARNVQEASSGTQEVSSSIGGVTQAASETGSAANQILTAAQSLSREANQLKGTVGKFLEGVRTA